MVPLRNLVPVILAGGAGTRLWPVSRDTFPKQLAQLTDGASLLQQTAEHWADAAASFCAVSGDEKMPQNLRNSAANMEARLYTNSKARERPSSSSSVGDPANMYCCAGTLSSPESAL